MRNSFLPLIPQLGVTVTILDKAVHAILHADFNSDKRDLNGNEISMGEFHLPICIRGYKAK